MSSKYQATEQTILDASWRLLDSGIAPSMEEVATAAGVSRQAVYLHFKNRGELLLSTVDHIRRELKVTELYAGIFEGAVPDLALEALMKIHESFTPRIIRASRAIEALRVSDAAFDAAWQVRQEGRLRLAQRIAAAFDSAGRLRQGWSTAKAGDLIYALTSTAMASVLLEQGWTTEQITALTQDIIKKTLVTAGEERNKQ